MSLGLTKTIIAASCTIVMNHAATSQVLKGRVTEKDESTHKLSPLPGTNVYWINTTKGTTADVKGKFNIPIVQPLPAKLVLSFVGFQNDTLVITDESFREVVLKKSIELKEVNIEARQGTTTVSTLNPFNVQKLNEGEILKAACCNLSEAFETNPTINVSYKDAVTGAKEIQLLGLSGIYSQLMTENIPSMKGIAGIYGLTFIPGPWMESIQITKGSGSVMNGFESTTGQINVEFKKPEESKTPRFYLNLFGEENTNAEINTFFKHKFSKHLSSVLMAHGNYMDRTIDRNEDSFHDMPHIKQVNLYNRWQYHSYRRLESQFGLKYIYDERHGGQVHPGEDDEVDHQHYFISDVVNKRAEVFGKLGVIYPGKPYQSIGNIVSFTYHDLKSSFGQKYYNAIEKSVYYQSIFQSILWSTSHQYKVGIGYQYDWLEDHFNTFNDLKIQQIPGAFGEYTYSYLEKFKLVLGVREDHHNEYGWFFTPRMHGKYNFTDDLIVRWSGGRSFRVPYAIADHVSVLASSKHVVFDEFILPERAWNYGINLTQRFEIAENEGTLSIDFYRTDFINQLIMDPYSDASLIHFYNLRGQSHSNSFQVMLNQELWKVLNFRLAYKTDDVRADYKGVMERKPLVARDRALFNIGYESGNRHWRFDYTVVREGKKKLVSTTVDQVYGRLPEYSPVFFVMNAQVTKVFKRFELYGGGENLLDFRQEHPIINPGNPFGNDFDASQVWGPIDGRRIYAGVRFSIM